MENKKKFIPDQKKGRTGGTPTVRGDGEVWWFHLDLLDDGGGDLLLELGYSPM